MADIFVFPDVGEGLHEGDIVRWLVKEGDTVSKNQPLVEMETAKAIVEIPSPRAGKIVKLYGLAGETIKVGAPLVGFDVVGEANSPGSTTTSLPPSQKSTSSPLSQPAPVSPQASMVHATPHTRKLARELGVDVTHVQGSGPGGRISDDDVLHAHQAQRSGIRAAVQQSTPEKVPQPVASPKGLEERIPLKGLRKTIAESMSRSVRTAAHVTHFDEADVTELVKLRKKEMANAKAAGVKLTYLPFIIKAVVTAMKAYPQFNATLLESSAEIIYKRYYHFGIAVDTSEGLIVPILRDVDKKSIMEIATELHLRSEQARTRIIDLAHLQGGTFTITNIGSIGGTNATPIIHHPESAILATFAIQDRPVVRENAIVVRQILPLALSFDHRITDGAQAARFVNEIKRHLEDPGLLLLDVV